MSTMIVVRCLSLLALQILGDLQLVIMLWVCAKFIIVGCFHIRISCLGLGLEDDVRDRGSNKNNMWTKA